MKIMAINALNNSLEYTLYDVPDNNIIANGNISRIGLEESFFSIKFNSEKITEAVEINDFIQAVRVLFDKLITLNVIKSADEIKGIGHRVVHGGSIYSTSTFINDKVIDDVESLSDLAPLYNSNEAKVMRAFREVVPNIMMVAVFDTAFYQTIKEEDYLYPVPYDWYVNYGVRKYGFYGTSHKYVCDVVRKQLNRDDFKLISCHLGNGGSVTAIDSMKAVDTSTGFTPLSGVMMGTRSGDIDPSIIPYVMEHEGKNVGEVIEDLNQNSGLLGLSKCSSDMRDIIEACDNGDNRALVAKNKFVRRVVDYIAQYYALLGGVDVIAFTAGIGENSVSVRREICERLSCFGVKIDLDLNTKRGELVKISTDDSSVDVYIIPTDEELMIANEAYKLIVNR